ncbi:MAG: YebC/PmpR family DNA-binding transcriptional regulator, partial [Calditrichia bacterium]|nr:YebC/PmpR family DNA-binding transcriptional regulator [Calditrichia bacterium]
LRTAVAAAKSANMPSKNMENAVKKGTGEMPGVVYEEILYEGYGPGGVALYINVMTDNKNRTVAEIRYLLSKYGGNLGESGCVAWIFEKKGLIRVNKKNYDEEELFMIALDAGAEDVQSDDEEYYEIYTEFENMESVKEEIEKNDVQIEEAVQTMIPQNTIKLDDKQAVQMIKLMEMLDDHDDIQDINANFDIDDEVIAQLAG